MKYDIIATGSKGNAVVFYDRVMVDCGVSFSKLAPVYRNLQLVLLTHVHGDHFQDRTISRLAYERPTLRFAAPEWLIGKLIACGVQKRNIDVIEPEIWYEYGAVMISAFSLHHDVPNVGYKIHFSSETKPETLVYATDTSKLPDIPNYDFYFVESNYLDAEDLASRIEKKQAEGAYCYEYRVAENHMSQEYVTDWLQRNGHSKSRYVFLHGHEERL